MSASSADEPASPAVFARPAPLGARAALAGLVLLGMASPVALVVLVLGAPERVRALLEAARGWPWGQAAAVGTVLALFALPLVLDLAFLAWARRRYGRCAVEGDQLVFDVALAPRWAGREVLALVDVSGRRVTDEGILVEAEGRSWARRLLFPLLVPASGEAELGRAVALLDAAPADPGDPERQATFGAGPPRWLYPALLALLAGLVLGPLAVVAARFGPGWAAGALVPFTVLQLAAIAWLDGAWVDPRTSRVHIGRAALLVGQRRMPYAEVVRWGTAGEVLAVEGGGARLLAWVGADVERAESLLAARLAAGGWAPPRELPGWAAPRRQRRRRLTAAAACGLVALLHLGVALSDPPIYAAATLVDDEGTLARLVYRVSDDEPRLLCLAGWGPLDGFAWHQDPEVVVPGLWVHTFQGGGRLTVDLGTGQGRAAERRVTLPPQTRFVLVDRDAIASSTAPLPAALTRAFVAEAAAGPRFYVESLPAWLEGVLGPATEPALTDALEGRTSLRTFDVVGPGGWRLVWGADHGRVDFLVLARASQALEIVRLPFSHRAGRGTSPLAVGEEAFVLVNGPGRVVTAPEWSLPEHAALLAATRRVEGGVPVPEATRELAARLWQPPRR